MALYLGSNEVALNTQVEVSAQPGEYEWIGAGVEYVGKLYEWNGTMDDTTYSSWTPSTTAGTILTAQSGVATFTIPDRRLETYYVLGRWGMDFAYNDGTTMTTAPIIFNYITLANYYVYPGSNVGQWESGEYTSYSYSVLVNNNFLEYYNSSGNLAIINSTYGPAYTNTIPSWSTSVSGNTVTVNIGRPALSARCNSTYFSTARATDIDTTNSTVKFRLDLFKGPKKNIYEQVRYRMITDMINDNWEL